MFILDTLPRDVYSLGTLRCIPIGWRSALTGNASLALGLNTHDGQITYVAVAEEFPDLSATPMEAALVA